MKFEDVVYEYQEVKRKTPSTIYGTLAAEYFLRHQEDIIAFRPPKKGERHVHWFDGKAKEATVDFWVDNPRYILRSPVKLLREYVVKVWDEPPKAGEWYMDNQDYRTNHFCVCYRNPQSPTTEDGYFRGDKRVTVEEVTK